MVCDRCLLNKAKGYSFCKECGEDLTNVECTSCDIYRERGDRYCSECGKDLDPQPKKSTFSNILDISGIIITAVLACYLLIETITAVWGISVVWDHLPTYTHSLFIVIPKVVTFFRFSGPAVQIYYLILIAVVVLFVYHIFKVSYRPTKEEGIEGLKRTPIYEALTLFAALLFVEYAYIFILMAVGVDVKSPFDEDEWEMMFTLLNASVYEELVCRVLYLGLPMLIVALVTRKKDTPWYRYLLGGFGMSRLVLIFILFSSLMFGLGHLGWGWWKIFPTFLFGLISGYMFCKYGLYATVCMHFLTDYMTASTWLGGAIPSLMMVAMLIVSLIGGIPFAISYTKRGCLWIKENFSPKQS